MNDNELITRSNERVSSFFKSLDRMVAGLERLAKTCKPTLGGERYLTDKEVSARLKLSRRTLQDYRDQGRIPYCQLGGKILYRESDIEKVLAENYRDTFR
jgi:excisionase family DNA binding protein